MTITGIFKIWPILLIISGCAGVTIQNEDEDPLKDKGIRYYEPRPFLLVHTDSKGGLVSKLVWLPDTRKVRTIRPYAFAAKNNATFKFSGGMLTQAKAEIDQTVIPSAIVSALKSSAVAAATAALNAVRNEDVKKLPAPILFAIDGDKDSGDWSITPSTPDPDHISLVLVQQPKEKK